MGPLLSTLPEELLDRVPAATLAEARRLLSVSHRLGALPPVTPTGVRKTVMLAVRQLYDVPVLSIDQRIPSSLDPFVKYAFRAPDNAVIEAVRIPLERPGRFVVCVSSQVGCAMGCAFCGTARMGLARNLSAWEIVDQVRLVRADLPPHTHVHGVVFQGMGEPLANVREVVRAARVISNPSALQVDARNVTVCTSGLGSALPTLFESLPNARLAVSIGSAIPEKRQRLIPLEKRWPLTAVLDLLADQARRTRIAPMWAWTLLRGVNDGDDEVDAMRGLVDRFSERSGMKPRLSLLSYNRIAADDTQESSSPERVDAIRSALGSLGIPVVRRYSGGSDVGAACGQLGRAPGPDKVSPSPSGPAGSP